MFSTLTNEAPGVAARQAPQIAKLVEISRGKIASATQSEGRTILILGVSLSQSYSHGEYVAQTLEGIREKFKNKLLESGISRDLHVVLLLSTAFDSANILSFDIHDPNSPNSLSAKAAMAEKTEAWITEHTPTLDQYRDDFTYTIIRSDKCIDNEEYRQILEAFINAYKNGQGQTQTDKTSADSRDQRLLKSLTKIDEKIDITDKTFFNKMKFVIEAYVGRHVTKGMTKTERDDIKQRSEWVVLHEYALILMLFLKKALPAFSDSISFGKSDEISFAYPYGNFGKESRNLAEALYGHRASDLYNVRIPDFCDPKPKRQLTTSSAATSPAVSIPRVMPELNSSTTKNLAGSPQEEQVILSFLVQSAAAQMQCGLEALKSDAAKQTLIELQMESLYKALQTLTKQRKAITKSPDIVSERTSTSPSTRQSSPSANSAVFFQTPLPSERSSTRSTTPEKRQSSADTISVVRQIPLARA